MDRGFMTLTFTADEVRSDWHYVDTILSKRISKRQRRVVIAPKAKWASVITPIV